jgi:hypothetical protein
VWQAVGHVSHAVPLISSGTVSTTDLFQWY